MSPKGLVMDMEHCGSIKSFEGGVARSLLFVIMFLDFFLSLMALRYRCFMNSLMIRGVQKKKSLVPEEETYNEFRFSLSTVCEVVLPVVILLFVGFLPAASRNVGRRHLKGKVTGKVASDN